ncbi:glycosyl hydrolase family 26 [Candidatus Bathyarchaeota archaeon]|nr:glycosyl hydrolase family 26 [Candidatus Bathyarchaeota archaeon]
MSEDISPVNPNASPEARKLLRFLYRISGKKTLTGQHEFLGRMSVITEKVKEITGKYPAVWGSDFGFSDERHDIDNIKYRTRLVDEIRKQHGSGAIITMTYHQANPAIGEPCLFEGGVISKLSDQQWKDLITPGTSIFEAWRKQMDIVVEILKKVQEARIPVLFRPYHEMNGNWFWWGGRKGQDGYIALYKQLFHYFTEHHKLNNLLWVWASDKPWSGVEDFYPGDEYIDVLGADIYPVKDYPEVYRQEWYERMVKLAKNKPLALTEFSVLPTEEILNKQPRWVWTMAWADLLLQANTTEEIVRFYNSKKTLTRKNTEIPSPKKQ